MRNTTWCCYDAGNTREVLNGEQPNEQPWFLCHCVMKLDKQADSGVREQHGGSLLCNVAI